MTDASGSCCTRGHRKTHVTESREVLYPWHPCFGQVIYIHEAAEERGGRVLHCDLENKPNALVFDRSCLDVRSGSMRACPAG